MFTFQIGDQIQVISTKSSHNGETGVICHMTKNPNIVTVQFKNGQRVNLWRTSIRRLDNRKEAHFYLQSPANSSTVLANSLLTDIQQTKQAFQNGQIVVHTTQLPFLSTDLLYQGYRLFLHTADLNVTEFRIGQPAGNIDVLSLDDNLYEAVRGTIL